MQLATLWYWLRNNFPIWKYWSFAFNRYSKFENKKKKKKKNKIDTNKNLKLTEIRFWKYQVGDNEKGGPFN